MNFARWANVSAPRASGAKCWRMGWATEEGKRQGVGREIEWSCLPWMSPHLSSLVRQCRTLSVRLLQLSAQQLLQPCSYGQAEWSCFCCGKDWRLGGPERHPLQVSIQGICAPQPCQVRLCHRLKEPFPVYLIADPRERDPSTALKSLWAVLLCF